MSITTMSDKELLGLASIRRADHAHAYDFGKHGWSAPAMVTYLAHEALQLRAQLRSARDLLARVAPVLRDESPAPNFGGMASIEVADIDRLLGMWAEGTTRQPVLDTTSASTAAPGKTEP